MRNPRRIGFLSFWLLNLSIGTAVDVSDSQAANQIVSLETSQERVPFEPQAALQAFQSEGSSPNFGEQAYALEERRAPLVTLRVVDGRGNVAEVPINFHEAQNDTRGFWGDVAVNGAALFLASVPFLILKELITWATAKRQRARAEARRALAAKRREAISTELSAADQEIRELWAKSGEQGGEEVDASVARLATVLDAYRDELKGYDAPALTAYLDSLVMQAAQLLRMQRKIDVGREAMEGVNGMLLDSREGPGATVPGTVKQGSKEFVAFNIPSSFPSEPWVVGQSLGATESSSSQRAFEDNLDRNRSTETKSDVSLKEKEWGVAARGGSTQDVRRGKPFKIEKPDISLVQRIMLENPGMPPAEVIRRATQLHSERTQKLMQYTP